MRWFVDINRRACRAFDRLLPERFSVDGNQHFLNELAPRYISCGAHVIDVGGGRHPFVSLELKVRKNLRVTGLDIDARELASAPAGAYDQQVVADLATVRLPLHGDIVICQAVLEHVADTEEAFKALAAMTRPGGRLLVFVPCRNAVFARLNLGLPERLKRALLYSIFPAAREGQGFTSYYRRCTPEDFTGLAHSVGLSVEKEILYFSSSYFTFLLPLHVGWRLLQLVLVTLLGRQGAETFSMVLKK